MPVYGGAGELPEQVLSSSPSSYCFDDIKDYAEVRYTTINFDNKIYVG